MNDKMARLEIGKRFPSHSILSEESAPHKGDSDLTWWLTGLTELLISQPVIMTILLLLLVCAGKHTDCGSN